MFSIKKDAGRPEKILPEVLPDGSREFQIRSTAEVDQVVEPLLAELEAAEFPEDDRFAVRLAVEEALINGVVHGNGNDPSKSVRVRYRVTGQALLVEIEDQGQGFDVQAVPDPASGENLEQVGGRGLFLMRSCMTWVRHNERGNCVKLCKYRSVA